jgi:hypothetical protein
MTEQFYAQSFQYPVVWRMVHPRVWWQAFSQPNVPSYHTVIAYHGFAAQNGSTRINHHVILHRWVPFGIGHAFIYA